MIIEEFYDSVRNPLKLLFSFTFGVVISSLVVFFIFAAMRNPWVKDHYKITAPYFSGSGINRPPALPANFNTSESRVDFFMLVVHQLTLDENKRNFIVEQQCLQNIASVSDKQFKSMLLYLDTYHNYGKDGNKNLIEGDIQRRLNFLFTDNFQEMALFDRGYPFIEGKLDYIRIRANIHSKFASSKMTSSKYWDIMSGCAPYITK